MASPPSKPKRVNVRRPEIMAQVEAEIANHYASPLVDFCKKHAGQLVVGNTTLILAKSFGFCYGVERAIDLAYATRRVFPTERIFLIGEIIHNPDVNAQLASMSIMSLPWKELSEEYDTLSAEDVVIVPAFGAPTHFMDKLQSIGCSVIDTTCGDVMKVWRRVKNYAQSGITSIIHGKAQHEETRATASRALGDKGNGHYLIILTEKDAQNVCDYIVGKGDKSSFLERFAGAFSKGFDPDKHLQKIGVANQTTMLQGETESLQQQLRRAIIQRDGNEKAFFLFDTICGATQDRQNALFDLLHHRESPPLDALFVIGGYNSSNTTHLAEIGAQKLPTFFIRNASCLHDLETILHYDIDKKEEISSNYHALLASHLPVSIGLTAGASCPNNLIEETILRLLTLRKVPLEKLDALKKVST